MISKKTETKRLTFWKIFNEKDMALKRFEFHESFMIDMVSKN